ncbi:hypothetical protein [Planococcus faecalis]|nr:hypothetical protein [Planococcus faecalis]
MKQIGGKLKQMREQNQLSVEDLANAVGFAKTVIWDMKVVKSK